MEPTYAEHNPRLPRTLAFGGTATSWNENGEFYLMRVETMMTILLAEF